MDFAIEVSWIVMAHSQKPDFVFRRNGRVRLNHPVASVHSTTGSRGVRISGSNAGYTMFRGSVKGIGYPLHSPVSPSLPPACVTLYRTLQLASYHSQTAACAVSCPILKPRTQLNTVLCADAIRSQSADDRQWIFWRGKAFLSLGYRALSLLH